MAKNSKNIIAHDALPEHAGLHQDAVPEIKPQDSEYHQLFNAIDFSNDGYISLSRLKRILSESGILDTDPRLNLNTLVQDSQDEQQLIDFEAFRNVVQKSTGTIIRDAIQGNLAIPDFKSFTSEISEIYDKVIQNKNGAVATYIPQLGRVNPDQFGIALCSIHGQRFSMGESNTPFCIQSICKPINYSIAMEQNGQDFVHKHVGREPSGIGFNGLALNAKGLPHNPMINSGAIMCCSMISPQQDMADRFELVLDYWTKLCGGQRAGFNNSVYLSERQTADRNFALGYFMKENQAFPAGTNLLETLEFYFQCCSIETTAQAMSVAAATLANAGICPLTGERILSPDTVKNCLSLMSSCGMYDFSGEFAFSIGLPAKSGVAGGIFVVVPNVLGIAIWSPRLDELGNSVRGIEFCKELVNHFNFHQFDSLIGEQNTKNDPRLKRNEAKIDLTVRLCSAASEGDLKEVQRLVSLGVNINSADYDGRTALHLAASEGQAKIVEYLCYKGANLNAKDRWGGTPLSDARRGQHKSVETFLESFAIR
jgi:glutaminase